MHRGWCQQGVGVRKGAARSTRLCCISAGRCNGPVTATSRQLNHSTSAATIAYAGANKRKGGRPGDMGHHDEYGSGRFGGQLDREMQFFEKVKQRLRSKEQYQDFLKCLNLYAQEIISRNELINLANVSVCV